MDEKWISIMWVGIVFSICMFLTFCVNSCRDVEIAQIKAGIVHQTSEESKWVKVGGDAQ